MISKEVIEKTKEFGFAQTKEYKRPVASGIDLANKKGQKLAEALGADKDIVLMGTLLIDCRLGLAISENQIKEHIQMSYEAAKELVKRYLLKADEKWSNLTLDICKKELEPQYKAIKEFLSKF